MRIRLIYILLLVATLPLFSCHKEVSIERPNALNGDFRAVIDGADWIAADTNKAAFMLGGLINISGVSVDGRQLSITLNDTIAGVYPLSQTTASFAAYVNNAASGLSAWSTNQGKDSTQAGGSVTITAIDKVHKTITGTFSFTVFRASDSTQKKITQGEFYKLPYADSLPGAKGSDTLSASINGTNWVAQSIIASGLTGSLVLSGSGTNGVQSVSLIMPLNVAAGTYPLDYTAMTYVGAYTQAPAMYLVSNQGTVTITENNTSTRQISGTFQFQAIDPMGVNPPEQLTNGYFSVQYSY